MFEPAANEIERMTEIDQSENILDRVCIAMPCTMNWDEMKGNDEVRLCSGCDKNVYNLSAMSKKRAEEVLSGPVLPCLQMSRREDGTIVTDDFPNVLKPLRTYWRSATGFFLSLITLLAPQVTSAEERLKPGMKGRPALMEGSNQSFAKTPLSKILRKSKYADSLGRPCEINPNLKHGTEEWRKGFTRSHWPTSLMFLNFN